MSLVYQVGYVPTTVLLRAGREAARFEGPYSRESLKDHVLKVIHG